MASLVENKWLGHFASKAARSLHSSANRNRTCVSQYTSPPEHVALHYTPTVEGISKWSSLRRSSVPAPTEWLEMQLRSFELEPANTRVEDGSLPRFEVVEEDVEDEVDSKHSYSTESTESLIIPFVNLNKRYFNEFEEVACLGRGGFGVVYRAKHKIDQSEYAVKRVDLRSLEGNELSMALSEARAMAAIPPHTNMVRYFGSWLEAGTSDAYDSSDELEIDESSLSSLGSSQSTSSIGGRYALYIQMGLCGEGFTLAQYLKTRQVDEQVVLGEAEGQILKQLVSAVSHMHKYGFEHLDLTPRNMFQLSDQKWCLGDFSFTQKFGSMVEHEVGTQLYAAPEVSGKTPSTLLIGAADVFSLGVMITELCMSFETAMERAVMLEKVRSQGWLPNTMVVNMPRLAGLVKEMISHIPSSRPCITRVADEISRHVNPEHGVLQELARSRERLQVLLAQSSPLAQPTSALSDEVARWKQLLSDPLLNT